MVVQSKASKGKALMQNLQRARELVQAFANEVSDNREWPNQHNEDRTRKELLDYIAKLEKNASKS